MNNKKDKLEVEKEVISDEMHEVHEGYVNKYRDLQNKYLKQTNCEYCTSVIISEPRTNSKETITTSMGQVGRGAKKLRLKAIVEYIRGLQSIVQKIAKSLVDNKDKECKTIGDILSNEVVEVNEVSGKEYEGIKKASVDKKDDSEMEEYSRAYR